MDRVDIKKIASDLANTLKQIRILNEEETRLKEIKAKLEYHLLAILNQTHEKTLSYSDIGKFSIVESEVWKAENLQNSSCEKSEWLSFLNKCFENKFLTLDEILSTKWNRLSQRNLEQLLEHFKEHEYLNALLVDGNFPGLKKVSICSLKWTPLR